MSEFFVWTPTRWKSNFTLQRILEGSSQWMVQWLVSMVIVSPLSRVAGPQARRNSDNLNTHPSKKQARRKSQSHRDFSVSCQSIFGNEPVNGERPSCTKKTGLPLKEGRLEDGHFNPLFKYTYVFSIGSTYVYVICSCCSSVCYPIISSWSFVAGYLGSR